jgi:hypothetical protein
MTDLMQGNVKGCFAQNRAPVGRALEMQRANPDGAGEIPTLVMHVNRMPAGYTQSSADFAFDVAPIGHWFTAIGEFLL